jgi:Winged helix-turn helix
MPQRRTITLSEDQRQQLLHYRDHDPRPDIRERCAALLKIADGQAAYTVARVGLLRPRDPDTLYHWLAYFEADGIAGLLVHRHGGTRRRCL